MKKALFINETYDVEDISYGKISEYLSNYTKGQICESLIVLDLVNNESF